MILIVHRIPRECLQWRDEVLFVCIFEAGTGERVKWVRWSRFWGENLESVRTTVSTVIDRRQSCCVFLKEHISVINVTETVAEHWNVYVFHLELRNIFGTVHYGLHPSAYEYILIVAEGLSRHEAANYKGYLWPLIFLIHFG